MHHGCRTNGMRGSPWLRNAHDELGTLLDGSFHMIMIDIVGEASTGTMLLEWSLVGSCTTSKNRYANIQSSSV